MINNLHQLIHSLTQNEKRYFKLHASFMFRGQDKRFVKLFDLIEKQQLYNESKIKITLGEKHFAQLKLQLLNKLLESLRAFYSGVSVRSLIDNHIADFRILLNKTMLVPAEKSLRRAETLAVNYELHSELISIKQLETELLVAIGDAKKLQAHIKNLRENIPLWMQFADNQLQVEKEYLLFVKLNREAEFIRSDKEQKFLDEFINAPILRNENKILTVRGKAYYYYIMGLYHFLSGRFNKSLEAFEAQLLLFYQKSQLAEELSVEYAKALANVCLLYNKTLNENKFKLNYEKLVKLNPSSVAIRKQVQYRNYVLKLNFFVAHCKLNDALNLIKEEQDEIRFLEEDQVFKATMVTEINYVMFDTIYVYMCTNQFSKANRIINDYINTAETSVKSDHYSLAKILHLYIQYELGNDDYISNEIKSLSRFLKENKKWHEFEKIGIQTITKLLNEKKSAVVKGIWKKLKQELEGLYLSRFEGNAMFSFNFVKWAEHKIGH